MRILWSGFCGGLEKDCLVPFDSVDYEKLDVDKWWVWHLLAKIIEVCDW